MDKSVGDEVVAVLNSGYIGEGEKVKEFENKLKTRFNNDCVLAVNSATSGEHLALHLLKKSQSFTKTFHGVASYEHQWVGINDGDEVLATPLTCTASNFPILANNFKIKWVDIDPNTLNMDLDDLARKITHKTKAIMLVHWGGYPNDLDKLKKIQEESYKLYGFEPAIIEDCAHSFGSTYKGKPLGSHGNICTFSFQAIKHLTSVDGGAIVLPHNNLYHRAKLLRWYGIDRENNKKDFRCEADIEEWGFKFHMNDVNATVGLNNLKGIDNLISIHRSNAKFYDEELKDVDGIQLLERKDDRESSFWIYSMLVDRRQDFMNKMKECEIMVSQVHERNDKHRCVAEYRSLLPNLESTIGKVISIPVGWWVTQKDRQYIVDCIKEGW